MIDQDTGEIKVPFLRTAYNYDMNAAGDESGLACDPAEGKTQQSFAEEADINVIVRRFGVTGQLPENPNPPVYGDFVGLNDYQSAVNAVLAAEAAFMAFPAEVRARFRNDPQEMMAFLADEKNRDEAVSLGLVNAAPVKERDVVQAVDELAAKLVPTPK